MSGLVDKVTHAFSSFAFGLLTPLLVHPWTANRKVTRAFVAFMFGRAFGHRYDQIIESFGDAYGAPMDRGIQRAVELRSSAGIRTILDCGTGTGFVSAQVARILPNAAVLATDLLVPMLRQARDRCDAAGIDALHVLGDAFALPVADASVDLVLAQNTMPCFREYARVLRPGGVALYVDSSAGWVTPVIRKIVRGLDLFARVEGEQVGSGFVIVAQAADGHDCAPDSLAAMLRCPLDHSELDRDDDRITCAQGHTFPVEDGFPALLRGRQQ